MGLTNHQKQFLKDLKKVRTTRKFVVEKTTILVDSGVFPPATDSLLLAQNIKAVEGKKILDLGCGAGTFSIIAGKKGASGIAADINPKAVENSKKNFLKHRVNFKAVKSNLFQNIPEQKFDIIVVNGPFADGKPSQFIEYAMLGFNNFYKNFFKKVGEYLKPSGKILLVQAGWINLNRFEKIITSNRFKFKVTDSKLSKDKQRKYLLYKITS